MARKKRKTLADRIKEGAAQFANLFADNEVKVIAFLTATLTRHAKNKYRALLKEQALRIFVQAVEGLYEAMLQEADKVSREIIREAYEGVQEAVEDDAGEWVQEEREIQPIQPSVVFPATTVPTAGMQTVDTICEQVYQASYQTLRFMRRDVNDIYRQIVEEVRDKWLEGANQETLNQAVREALTKFAANGIEGFEDKAGRKWGLYEYTEMAMRTAIHRAGLQATIDTASKLGMDLVFLTQHPGACPLCAAWYGKIMSISGTSSQYPSLQSAMNAGLFHPNCADTLQIYIPNVSNVNAGMSPFTPERSAERYKMSQRQRALERECRRMKRIQAAAMTPQDERIARAKVVRIQAQIRALCKKYDLPRMYYREGGRVKLSQEALKLKPIKL